MNEKSPKQCALCGNCTVVCPVYRVTGRETLTARGKLHLLSTELAAGPSSHFQDIFAQCLLCGACEDACSRQLPIRKEIVRARSSFSNLYGKHPLKRAFARKALSSPALLEGLVKAGLSLSRLSLLPKKSGLRLKLAVLETDQKKFSGAPGQRTKEEAADGPHISLFPGCFAKYLQSSISEATGDLAENLSDKPVYEPDDQVCCGLAAWSSGRIDEAKELAKSNIEAFSRVPGPILTSCASCSAHLQDYPDLFKDDPQWREKAEEFSSRVVEFISFVTHAWQDKASGSAVPARVYYHEPCHLRFDGNYSGNAQLLLENIENVLLVKPDKGQKCCGQGGLFHLGYPELSKEIFATAYDRFAAEDVDVVLTTCSGCLMQWQAGLAHKGSSVRAVHLAVWLRTCMQING